VAQTWQFPSTQPRPHGRWRESGRIWHFSSSQARPLSDVRPPVAKCDDTTCGVRVVALPITPSLVHRVGHRAVGFHAYPELLVQGIPVSGALSIPRPRPPPRGGQPMRALDIPQVPEFQQGVGTRADVGQRAGQLTTPVGPPPARQGRRQLGRCGQPAAAGPGQPAESIVQGGSAQGQVENGLLDPGAGRHPSRVTDPADVAAPVQHYPGNRLDPAISWHRNVNGTADRSQLVKLGRGGMGQYRPLASPEQRGPEGGRAGWFAAESRVHTLVQPLPPAAADHRLQQRRSHPSSQRLNPGDDTFLLALSGEF
jgi:hypothetical protein